MTPGSKTHIIDLPGNVATTVDVSQASRIAIYASAASAVTKLEVSADGTLFVDYKPFTAADEIHIIGDYMPCRFIKVTVASSQTAQVAYREYTR